MSKPPCASTRRLSTSRSLAASAPTSSSCVGWPATVYLLAKDAGTIGAGGDPRRYSRHWTPVHADIVVDDVDAAVERAVAAGAKLEAAGQGHGLWQDRHAGRPVRPRLLPAAVQRAGYDALLGLGLMPDRGPPGRSCQASHDHERAGGPLRQTTAAAGCRSPRPSRGRRPSAGSARGSPGWPRSPAASDPAPAPRGCRRSESRCRRSARRRHRPGRPP